MVVVVFISYIVRVCTHLPHVVVEGNFISRQTRTWTRQYRASETHEIKHMELLLEWLPKHMVNNPELTVVHGDYRSVAAFADTPARVLQSSRKH